MLFYGLVLILSIFITDVSCEYQTPPENDKILYFAYGSNLLMSRMHISNPSATFFGIAKLMDYRLDFAIIVKDWRGAVATIVPDPDNVVWGALWTLDKDKISNLDAQEGVHINMYYPTNVTVIFPDNSTATARTYIETKTPEKIKGSNIPFNRKPSSTYLKVIILGAYESGLPMDYVKSLYEIENNELTASPKRLAELGPDFKKASKLIF